MSKKLKVGIIGLGAIGKVHANAYQATDTAEIGAICDISKEVLASEGERLNVSDCFLDYKKLLKTDVDAVSVCVGNALHKKVAIAALEAGKHVLLEKPMAMNAKQADDICKAAKKAKKVGQMGMCNRQNPQAQVVREYIESGFFGEIYHMRAVLIRHRGIPGLGGWFTTKSASGGGPMIDLGVHWFDLSMWLSGLWKPTSVSAMTYAKFGPRMGDYKYVGMWAGPPKLDGVCDVEDYSAGFVRFGKKATMSFEIVWAANTQDSGFIEILGDKAGTRIMDGNPLKIYTEHGDRPACIEPMYNQNVNTYEQQTIKFVKACLGKGKPAATFEEGRTCMKLIDAIYASGKAGKEVPIK